MEFQLLNGSIELYYILKEKKNNIYLPLPIKSYRRQI